MKKLVEIKIERKENGVLITTIAHREGMLSTTYVHEYVARFAPIDDYSRGDGKKFGFSTIKDIVEVLTPMLEQMYREYYESNTQKEEDEKS